MYIHSTNKLINPIKDIKEYRKELKEISKINLRRSSKFNVLAVLGALKAVKDINLSDNCGIYVASEYGPINDVYRIMQTVSEEDYIVMPFDFLNVNSNNVSFYVSQALEAKGKNTLITSRYLSFEKTLQLALFDLEINDVNDVLIGGVDESLSCVENFDKYLSFAKKTQSLDGSCWFYLNNKKSNSIAQITNIFELNSYEDLHKLLENDYSNIALNQFAQTDENITSKINKKKIILEDSFYGCEAALHILNLCDKKGSHLYVAKDDKKNLVAIELKV